jgi:predicted nuclease of predicted toxin-antitoxin system
MPRMRLLLDHNVPDSVAAVFRAAGHEVLLVRELLPTDSSDQLVATASELEGAILVSVDRDFKQIAPRIPKGMRGRFKKLSRISLECSEPQAAQRVRVAMTLIEAEWEIAQSSHDSRMFITIQNAGIKTHR